MWHRSPPPKFARALSGRQIRYRQFVRPTFPQQGEHHEDLRSISYGIQDSGNGQENRRKVQRPVFSEKGSACAAWPDSNAWQERSRASSPLLSRGCLEFRAGCTEGECQALHVGELGAFVGQGLRFVKGNFEEAAARQYTKRR